MLFPLAASCIITGVKTYGGVDAAIPQAPVAALVGLLYAACAKRALGL